MILVGSPSQQSLAGNAVVESFRELKSRTTSRETSSGGTPRRVLLVTEPHTDINAGFVVVMESADDAPLDLEEVALWLCRRQPFLLTKGCPISQATWTGPMNLLYDWCLDMAERPSSPHWEGPTKTTQALVRGFAKRLNPKAQTQVSQKFSNPASLQLFSRQRKGSKSRTNGLTTCLLS